MAKPMVEMLDEAKGHQLETLQAANLEKSRVATMAQQRVKLSASLTGSHWAAHLVLLMVAMKVEQKADRMGLEKGNM